MNPKSVERAYLTLKRINEDACETIHEDIKDPYLDFYQRYVINIDGSTPRREIGGQKFGLEYLESFEVITPADYGDKTKIYIINFHKKLKNRHLKFETSVS